MRVQKWQSTIFEKKSWGLQMGKNPHFGGIFNVSCPYLENGFNDFDEILRLKSSDGIYLTPHENYMS